MFDTYYALVCSQIYKVLGDPSEVEDIAQEIFFELWKKRDHLDIKSSIGAYLKQMARTRTLNHIRNRKIKWQEDESVLLDIASIQASVTDELEGQDVKIFITKAIDALPPKCRMIFSLSRFEDMTNREIAEQLGISIKTVENQMTKALKSLKSAIGHYNKIE